MSKATDQFRIDLPREAAFWACREALVEMGWGVESIEPDRLVTRRSWWGFARDAAAIEVTLSETGSAATAIALDAHLRWWGGKREIENEMNRLRNAIEVAAHRLIGSSVPMRTDDRAPVQLPGAHLLVGLRRVL